MQARRVRKRKPAKQYAVDFRAAYGLRATVLEQYGEPRSLLVSARIECLSFVTAEWYGTVGLTLGFFCGMGLVWSPLGVVYFLS